MYLKIYFSLFLFHYNLTDSNVCQKTGESVNRLDKTHILTFLKKPNYIKCNLKFIYGSLFYLCKYKYIFIVSCYRICIVIFNNHVLSFIGLLLKLWDSNDPENPEKIISLRSVKILLSFDIKFIFINSIDMKLNIFMLFFLHQYHHQQ